MFLLNIEKLKVEYLVTQLYKMQKLIPIGIACFLNFDFNINAYILFNGKTSKLAFETIERPSSSHLATCGWCHLQSMIIILITNPPYQDLSEVSNKRQHEGAKAPTVP